MRYHLAILSLIVLTRPLLAAEMRSISGVKFPNEISEAGLPVVAQAWALDKKTRHFPGFADLLPYVLRSPHQQEAGSCLYMSLTGIAEFWLSFLNPGESREPEGPLDLSERYLMNLAGSTGVPNWKTDSIYLFNKNRAAALNTDYRFTKGWVKKNARGNYVKAQPTEAGAEYGTRFNWINELNLTDASSLVALPRFEREVLFADPASDQWNVGVMPTDIIERIKTALVTRRAPVHVIYNHYGYWHAVMIVGFDDQADSKGCNFTVKFIESMAQKAADLRRQAGSALSPEERERLIKAAARAEHISTKASDAFNKGGGCQPTGMFYVRDSIYTDSDGPVYDYDVTRSGDEHPYSRTIVLHEYEWVRYMANHATQIYLKDPVSF